MKFSHNGRLVEFQGDINFVQHLITPPQLRHSIRKDDASAYFHIFVTQTELPSTRTHFHHIPPEIQTLIWNKLFNSFCKVNLFSKFQSVHSPRRRLNICITLCQLKGSNQLPLKSRQFNTGQYLIARELYAASLVWPDSIKVYSRICLFDSTINIFDDEGTFSMVYRSSTCF